VCIAVLHTLVAGLLARIQYPEGPATGHHDTGFSWFPCVYKRVLRWFPRLQVATACFSYSPTDLNLLDPYFIFMHMHYNHCHRPTVKYIIMTIIIIIIIIIISFMQGKKGKAVPLQAWSGPEGSRKLRFPDFMTAVQDGSKFVSLTHRPPLPPGNAPGSNFC